MAETKPRAEQVRFISDKTGPHILDEYIEACERNGIPLSALIDQLFDVDGNFQQGLFSFRIKDAGGGNYQLQYRVGTYVDPEEAWIDISEAVFDQILDAANQAKTDAEAASTVAQAQVGLATTQANNSSASATLSQAWATQLATPVSGGEYSAKYHAQASATSAGAAATSASQAQAAVDGIPYRDVVFITSANSPYTINNTNRGKLISVDTSGGAVTITLSQISTLTMPFTIGIKKATSDCNAVTVNRSGTDTIDVAATSYSIGGVAGVNLVADTDTTPDRWTSAAFGASAGETRTQTFDATTHFTPGSTTTLTLTNSPIAPSSAAVLVFFDGVCQFPSEYSYNTGTGVITFSSAIPLGVKKVFTTWQASSLSIGTPGSGTVGTSSLDSALNGRIKNVNIRKLTSGTSYVPTAGCTFAIVYLQAPGGPGGGYSTNTGGTDAGNITWGTGAAQVVAKGGLLGQWGYTNAGIPFASMPTLGSDGNGTYNVIYHKGVVPGVYADNTYYGGTGANSRFGTGGYVPGNTNSASSDAYGYGAGGGGGNTSNNAYPGGQGGWAGEEVCIHLSGATLTTTTYAIGSLGTKPSGSLSGQGSPGVIIIEEYFA